MEVAERHRRTFAVGTCSIQYLRRALYSFLVVLCITLVGMFGFGSRSGILYSQDLSSRSLAT